MEVDENAGNAFLELGTFPIEKILSYLTLKNRLDAELVCKRLRRISLNGFLSLDLKDLFSSEVPNKKKVERLWKLCCSRVRVLSFDFEEWLDMEMVLEVLANSPAPRLLSVRYCWGSQNIFGEYFGLLSRREIIPWEIRLIVKAFPHVQKIRLEGALITGAGLESLGQHCKELRFIDISKCRPITEMVLLRFLNGLFREVSERQPVAVKGKFLDMNNWCKAEQLEVSVEDFQKKRIIIDHHMKKVEKLVERRLSLQ